MSSQPERCQTINRSPVACAVSTMLTLFFPRRCRPGGAIEAALFWACTIGIPSKSHFVVLAQTLFHLSLGGPDVLNKAVALGQAVEGIVGLTHGADEAAEGVDVVLAGDSTAGLVDLGDGDLDRGVVLGLDDAVGGRALAGDVAVGRGGSV